MRKVVKSKKLHSLVLALIMVFSVLLFGACTDNEESQNTNIKVVYKPFSTSRPTLLSDTYGEIIYDSLLETSGDVLSRLVGEYGIGEISVKDGSSTKTVSPNLKNINFKTLLDLTATPTAEETLNYVSDFSALTNVFFNQASKILVLSNYAASASDVGDIVTYDGSVYTASKDLSLVSDSGGSVGSGQQMTANKVYKYVSVPKVSYIFIGGYTGSNSNENNYSSIEPNAKNYVSKFFNTHFGAIQKTVTGIPMADGSDRSIMDGFSASWEKSLVGADGDFSTPEKFLNVYVNKYRLELAVEIAKTALVGGDTFSEGILLQMYNSAKSGTSDQKQEFLEECCKYIDHIYLSGQDAQVLSSFIFSDFIGISALDTNFSKDFANVCTLVLEANHQNFEYQPILEYQTFQSDHLEEFEVDGYIQSIIFMSSDEMTFMSLILVLLETSDSLAGFDFTLRHCEGGNLVEYPIAVNESDLLNNEITFDVDDATGEDVLKIQSFVDNTPSSSKKNTLAEGTATYFISSKDTLNTKGYCWVYNDLSTDFIEFSFGCLNPLSFANIKIDVLLI